MEIKAFKYKRGRIWWMGWKDEDGKPQRKSLKETDGTAAGVKLAEEIKLLRKGKTDDPIKGIRWSTLRENVLRGYSGKTLKGYIDTFNHFERICNPVTVDSPTYKDAKNFKDTLRHYRIPKRRNKVMALNSVNIHIRNMHHIFVEAVRLNYCQKNIFEEIEQIKLTKRIPRFMTVPEVEKLKMTTKARTMFPDQYLMTLFLLHTGFRKLELLNLRAESIDMDRKVLYLHGSETWDPKDREEHAIGLHPDIEAELKKRMPLKGYIFPGRKGGPRNKDAFGRLFNRILKRAGISYTGCHITRHTFGTHWPGSQKALQRVLGHSDPQTTAKYSHVTTEELMGVRNMNYGDFR